MFVHKYSISVGMTVEGFANIYCKYCVLKLVKSRKTPVFYSFSIIGGLKGNDRSAGDQNQGIADKRCWIP